MDGFGLFGEILRGWYVSGFGVLVIFFIFKVGGFSIGEEIILFDEVENSL